MNEKEDGAKGWRGQINLVVVLLNLLNLFLLLNISLLGQGIDNLDVGGLPGSEISSGINNGGLDISPKSRMLIQMLLAKYWSI